MRAHVDLLKINDRAIGQRAHKCAVVVKVAAFTLILIQDQPKKCELDHTERYIYKEDCGSTGSRPQSAIKTKGQTFDAQIAALQAAGCGEDIRRKAERS